MNSLSSTVSMAGSGLRIVCVETSRVAWMRRCPDLDINWPEFQLRSYQIGITRSRSLFTSFSTPNTTSVSDKNAAKTVVGGLCLRASIKQEWLVARTPTVSVGDTPHSDTDALRLVQASLDRSLVVRCRRTLDVELSDGALAHIRTHALQGASKFRDRPVVCQMRLRANTIDWNAGCDPALHCGCQAACLGIAGRIEIVFVDVELGCWVCSTSSTESNSDEVCRVSIRWQRLMLITHLRRVRCRKPKSGRTRFPRRS